MTESITQKLFIADLIELFKPLSLIPEDPLSETVGVLLRTVDEFLDLLVAVHNTPLGEAYHIMDTLRLMDFLKDMRKEDMFIRYVHQLVNVQLQSNNLVEAALSLKLHADIYAWDVHERVPALTDPDLPEQTAFERREQLFLEMIGYFEDGRSWELALDTYRELADNYEHTVFEYTKLARCYRAMAKLQESILEGNKSEPRFYRVAYYGMGFPVGLRERQFVVQAGPYEGLQMFADRMLMQHPAARLVDDHVDSVEGQFIHILPVTPEINYAVPAYRKQRVPANVRDYLAKLGIRAFSIAHQPAEDAAEDAWTEKTVFITVEPFPAILKRSEVLDSVIVGVSPVERAIEEVLRRTLELQELDHKYSEQKIVDVSPFSICLTNAVDANKSVASYRNLLEEHETKEELRESLRTVMAEHVATIKKALSTHARIVPDNLRSVQANCSKAFEATFRRELAEASPPPLAVPSVPSGQWKPQSTTPHQQQSLHEATSAQTHKLEHHPTPLTVPPPQVLQVRPQRSMSVRSEANTEKSASTGRRLTSMIFGNSGAKEVIVSYRPPMPPLPTGSLPPPPPPPESLRSVSTSRSRSNSVSTSRSRKSSKSAGPARGRESLDERDRPKTPGRLQKGVGSVKRRWSALHLVPNGGGKREGKRDRSRGDGGSDMGSTLEEEED